MINVLIVVHVYKGQNGEKLAFQYVTEFLRLVKSNELLISACIHFYGFDFGEQELVKSLWHGVGLQSSRITCRFSDKSVSEVPTLRQAIMLARGLEKKDYILYLHSKGASYANQERFKNWSLHAVGALAAALDHIAENSALANRYSIFGSFASIGVLERFGSLIPHYSGNFWLVKAEVLAKRDASQRWYTDAFHNRHSAEAILGIAEKPENFLNLDDNYALRSQVKPNSNLVYLRIRKELAYLSKASPEALNYLDSYIASYYTHLSQQHETYSSRRLAWGLRRALFGNKSQLRRSSLLSWMLDRIVPWYQTELYRSYAGPKQYDVLNGYIDVYTPSNDDYLS